MMLERDIGVQRRQAFVEGVLKEKEKAKAEEFVKE
jgi:hypothetical protein